MMDLNGKTIVVTGASSGIGEALVRKLAQLDGARVAVMARRFDSLEWLAAEFAGAPSDIFPVRCDVSSRDDVQRAFAEVRAKFGPIDVAVLNAGVIHFVTDRAFDTAKARQMVDINFMGVLYCFEALMPEMKERGSGVIAGVASLAYARGYPKTGVYSATKSALNTFLESMRLDLKPYGIKVVIINPGYVRTGMLKGTEFKLFSIVTAAKAADYIVRGLTKGRKLIQFPPSTVFATRVARLLPNFIFDIVMKGFKNKKR